MLPQTEGIYKKEFYHWQLCGSQTHTRIQGYSGNCMKAELYWYFLQSERKPSCLGKISLHLEKLLGNIIRSLWGAAGPEEVTYNERWWLLKQSCFFGRWASICSLLWHCASHLSMCKYLSFLFPQAVPLDGGKMSEGYTW